MIFSPSVGLYENVVVLDYENEHANLIIKHKFLSNQKRNTIESNALAKLNNEGKFLKAGETLQYIITDYYQTRSKNNRAIPVELINERTCYDVKRYIELLTEACNSVTEPFGLKMTIPVSSLMSNSTYLKPALDTALASIPATVDLAIGFELQILAQQSGRWLLPEVWNYNN